MTVIRKLNSWCDIFFRQPWKYKPQLCGLTVDLRKTTRENSVELHDVSTPNIFFFFFQTKMIWQDRGETAIKR